MQEWKMRHGKNAGVEIAGVDNAGGNRKGRKCESRKWGSNNIWRTGNVLIFLLKVVSRHGHVYVAYMAALKAEQIDRS